MSLPAGWLASKLGYKGGIIAGLLMVAVGGFWFIPATHINAHGARGQRVAHHRVRRVPGGRLRHRLRADVPGNDRQSLHHRAGRPALRGHAHQPGAILQRRRLDLRPDRRQHVLLCQGRRGPQHGQPDALHSLRRRRGRRDRARGRSSTSPTFPTSRPRTTITWTMPRPASRTPSGRIRTS